MFASRGPATQFWPVNIFVRHANTKLAEFGRNIAKFCPIETVNSAEFAERGKCLLTSWPNPTNIDQFLAKTCIVWPICARVRQKLANFSPSSIKPKLANVCPNSVRVGKMLANIGQCWSESEKNMTNVRQHRRTLGRPRFCLRGVAQVEFYRMGIIHIVGIL